MEYESVLINRIEENSKCSAIYKNSELMHLRMNIVPLEFTACGLFPINCKLIYSKFEMMNLIDQLCKIPVYHKFEKLMYFKLERQSSDFYICGLFPINCTLSFMVRK
ncbi:hypothetical protein MTP99_015828 [Tenebrio molitor]|nr:hypothetical protein MTP99_015828 [Tenebrio molitor]